MEDSKKEKRAIIFYGTLGGGHKSAAYALKDEMKKSGYRVYMIDFIAFFNPKFNKFFQKTYMKFSRKEMKIFTNLYELADKIGDEKVMEKLYKINSHKLSKIINKIDPEYIISTFPIGIYYLGKLKSEEKINKNISISVIITDFDAFSFYYDNENYLNNFFVASEDVKKDLISRKIPKEKIYVTGIPIKESFRKKYKKEETLKLLKETGYKGDMPLAIFFGGGSMGLQSKKTKEIFLKMVKNLEDFFFIFITGKNKKMYEEYIKLIQKENIKNAYILEYTKNVAEIMELSKIVISKPGGLTTSETLAKGKPFFMENPIAGQELANADYVEKNGAGVKITEKNIDEIIYKIKNEKDFLKKLSNNSKKIGKPNASIDIIKLLEKKEKDFDRKNNQKGTF